MNKIKKNKGFTLVELLVVIAIIGILSTIAIPNLYKSINKAKAKKLVVEMNVISNAITEYYLEHGTLDLKVKENSGSTSIIDHMYLKDHKDLEANFDSPISKSPFGGWYYIEDEDDYIELTIMHIPPQGEYHGIVELNEKTNKAISGMQTMQTMKDQIEKDSSGKIKISDRGATVKIEKP